LNLKIEFTKHAHQKLKEREIEEEEVMQIIKQPDEALLDTETGNIILIGQRSLRSEHKLLLVLSDDMERVITIIDTSKTDIVDKRKENKRWIRIK